MYACCWQRVSRERRDVRRVAGTKAVNRNKLLGFVSMKTMSAVTTNAELLWGLRICGA